MTRLRPAAPAGFAPFPPQAVGQSVPARFEAQVARHAGRLALAGRDEQLSYGELNRLANEVAHAVLDRRRPAGERVAMLVESGTRPVVVGLGIMKAGQALVALDPAHPVGHNRAILSQAEVPLLLTDRAHLAQAREIAAAEVAVLDVETRRPAPPEARDPGLSLSPDALAQLMFTSGTTGAPKGVAWSHRTLLHFSRRTTNDLRIHAADRHTALRAVSFAGWTFDLLFALCNGASLHCFDPRTDGLRALGDWLEREEITLYRSATSVFRAFASALDGQGRCPRLRVSVVTAEPVHPSDVELFRRRFSDRGLLGNELGLTETGTVRSFFLDKNTALLDDRVPVGYPVDDVDVILLDADGREVEPGAVGEIVVRSRYLATGYWRQPELTATRFRPDPRGGPERLYLTGDLGTMAPDGCLVHRGRRDLQVKVRGHRVEIEDVEAALLTVPGVRTAAVASRTDGLGGARLVAYVVPAGEAAPSVRALREALAGRIPEHMIPASVVPLAVMPLTSGGKVDRRALPAPPATRAALDTAFVAPRTPLEERLCRIWCEVLDLEEIGVHDDFLELGGDSLQAEGIVARVQSLLASPIAPGALFAAPTVEAMALLLLSDLAAEPD